MTDPILQLKNTFEHDEPCSDQLIADAIHCLEKRLRHHSRLTLNRSKLVYDYLRLQLGQELDEVFACLFLNQHLQLIAFEKLFYGTVNQAIVFPRSIVKKALEYNASKLIIAHNHPSQKCDPSIADQMITNNIKKILNIIDVKLVDHIIVTGKDTYSFAKHHLL